MVGIWLIRSPLFSHERAVTPAKEVNKKAMAAFAAKAKRQMTESAAESAARDENEVAVRKLLHATLVGTGINPHLAAKVFNPQSKVREAIRKLEAAGVSVGAEGTIRVDLGGAEALLTDALRDVLRGIKGSLVTDGASFKRSKAVGVMFASNAWSPGAGASPAGACTSTTTSASTTTKRWPWMFAPPSRGSTSTSSRFLL
jgi:hypothetical protein